LVDTANTMLYMHTNTENTLLAPSSFCGEISDILMHVTDFFPFKHFLYISEVSKGFLYSSYRFQDKKDQNGLNTDKFEFLLAVRFRY
jgi:hypothetical protein